MPDELRAALRIAKEATNGWACYAKWKAEHADIARLHREIAALEAVAPPQEAEQQALTDEKILELWRAFSGPHAQLTGPIIRLAHAVRGLPAEPGTRQP